MKAMQGENLVFGTNTNDREMFAVEEIKDVEINEVKGIIGSVGNLFLKPGDNPIDFELCAFHGYHEHALELYIEMQKLGFLPYGLTRPLIIQACMFLGSYDLCRTVHCHALQMELRNHLHVVIETLGMYEKLGKMENARQLFDGTLVRSLVSWDTMVLGYAFNSDSFGASRIFKWMELEGLQPNSVTWTSLLSSHARCGLYNETLKLFKGMRTRRIEISAEALLWYYLCVLIWLKLTGTKKSMNMLFKEDMKIICL
ncbi:putative pentatricopeptide repeat-containing protein [Spatholobus suberectus]|nr:putative pentatricopeptide repeat-containing protein [Spatholobus suberectus]